MANLPYGINAWIFLNEDEPSGTHYNSANSCYQSLVKFGVYKDVTFLGIAFFEVISTAHGYTIEIGDSSHPDGLNNQDYLKSVLHDARQINPDIKFLATMGYSGEQTLAEIFIGGGDPKTQAHAFANNLVSYLKSHHMNGVDIDWEPPLSDHMTKANFQILFSTIRQVFDQQSETFYLSFTPAWPTQTTDYPTVNSAFDFVSPQFYDGTPLIRFLNAGISPDKIGYGAQFEPGNSVPNASAQQVWHQVSEGFAKDDKTYKYQDIFVWRFNSGNFQFEQAQFMILYQLASRPTGHSFDDEPVVGAAGYPQMTQIMIRSGDVLDSIQTENTGMGTYNQGTQKTGTGVFTLLSHGGNSGDPLGVNIPFDDPIVSVCGFTGLWYDWECVLQLTLTGKSGITYGPFGTMAGASTQKAFTQSAGEGQSVVAFRGTTVTVSLSDGRQTDIIASLDAIFA
ncbi:MAG: hypothetical protein CENE_02272 [Candidatus Celerinatantimonas neptuna]|nr:MAG: hypothetical protein CENE_02272 [Candidatus Celerinatantimonas neptuna]